MQQNLFSGATLTLDGDVVALPIGEVVGVLQTRDWPDLAFVLTWVRYFLDGLCQASERSAVGEFQYPDG